MEIVMHEREGAMQRVVVSIVENDGRFLLVHRRLPEGRLGWVFPGGKVEDGERESEASAREVREETGIICQPKHELDSRIHPDSERMVSYWICSYAGGEPEILEPHKIDDVAWLSPTEIEERITSDLSPAVAAHIASAANVKLRRRPKL
jgi:8-oxo-dGTP diphosphatase